jgi:hypothetical protein
MFPQTNTFEASIFKIRVQIIRNMICHQLREHLQIYTTQIQNYALDLNIPTTSHSDIFTEYLRLLEKFGVVSLS